MQCVHVHLQYGHTLFGTLTWVIYGVLSCMFVRYFRYWRSAEIIHAYVLGQYFERTLVWTMVWNSSGQWSRTCLTRGHFGLELVWSEAASSAQRALSAHSSDQSSLRSGTVWSEVISSATSTWDMKNRKNEEIAKIMRTLRLSCWLYRLRSYSPNQLKIDTE